MSGTAPGCEAEMPDLTGEALQANGDVWDSAGMRGPAPRRQAAWVTAR